MHRFHVQGSAAACLKRNRTNQHRSSIPLAPPRLTATLSALFFAFAAILTSTVAHATYPEVSGDTITWSGNDWYQVQDSTTLVTVCEGGNSCRVPAGQYIVINHSTGERFEEVQIGPRVEGSAIVWPPDGWYQVQTMSNFETVCEGGTRCEVSPGSYVVINHDAGVRWNNIRVRANEVVETPASTPSVDGNTISWTGNDWIEVQTASDYTLVCEGPGVCNVPSGTYNIINHTSGMRYENIVVGEGVSVDGNTISWTGDDWFQVLDESDYTSLCEGGSSCVVPAGQYVAINLDSGQRYPGLVVMEGEGGTGSSDDNADDPASNNDGDTNSEDDSGLNPDEDLADDGMDDSPAIGEPLNSLAAAIMGAWQSECRDYPARGTSERHILAIGEDYIAQDFYEYDGLECAGVPRGKSFPLRIYDYSLDETSNVTGVEIANAIDLEITQLSEVGTLRDGASLGQMRYGLIAVTADGQLQFRDGTSSSPENRPDSFEDFGQSFMQRNQTSIEVSSIDDFIGSYRTSCRLTEGGSYYSTVTVTSDSADSVDDYFDNNFCAGNSVLRLNEPTTSVPEQSPITTFFGDPALPVYVLVAPQEVVYGGDLLGFDLRQGKERYTLFALANGNTLMRGDCVVRESTCKTTAANSADMIDYEFNSDQRYQRIEDPAQPNEGNTDTAAIAGIWDFSSPDTGFYAYQQNNADGTSVYFEVVGDSPDATDACLQAYEESLRSYDDNVYLYTHDDEVSGYSLFFRQYVENGVLVQLDPESEDRNEFPALDTLPPLPAC